VLKTICQRKTNKTSLKSGFKTNIGTYYAIYREQYSGTYSLALFEILIIK